MDPRVSAITSRIRLSLTYDKDIYELYGYASPRVDCAAATRDFAAAWTEHYGRPPTDAQIRQAVDEFLLRHTNLLARIGENKEI